MKRRNFMKVATTLAAIPAVNCVASTTSVIPTSQKEIYEWRVYTLTGNGASLDPFFKDVLIPFYNRKKVKVGAFSLYKKEEVEQRWLLFIYPDMSTYYQLKKDIWKDQAFMQAAQPFYDATAPAPVYSNIETYLCEAFDKIPTHREPDKNRGLFEIRIYHSPNEEANQRKVRMFNVDEIDIFDKVGVNSVCYGEILAGPRMPALMYLLWYKDEEARSAAWTEFSKHPDWQRIRGLKEYAHTATNNQSIFFSPLPYSQL
ncbi:NIPSNAP family protein [Parabacteroides sp. PF5-9]|uniref:NIPSNAP family protein n=1 Tax=Parabacteroides sp. PF5-9 TaxID=1742404 RepID=UPI00247498F5|nr:NIPSNAP family protein [Parabacteroides sp. PF5-9]MDH6357667.1 hypothetical protein [Parabacteroides sp. PF5-9]